MWQTLVCVSASLSRSPSESQTAWPSVVFGPSRPKRSMKSTAVPPSPRHARVLLLIGRFDEMHMDGNAVLLGAVGQHGESLVGAPLLVRRRELDPDALLALVLGAKMIEQRDGLLRRHLKAGEILGEKRANIGGHARQELFVGLVDEMVLLAQRVAVGHPHADVFVGADNGLGLRLGLSGDRRGSSRAGAAPWSCRRPPSRKQNRACRNRGCGRASRCWSRTRARASCRICRAGPSTARCDDAR